MLLLFSMTNEMYLDGMLALLFSKSSPRRLLGRWGKGNFPSH
jgi:hypothetical protein